MFPALKSLARVGGNFTLGVRFGFDVLILLLLIIIIIIIIYILKNYVNKS